MLHLKKQKVNYWVQKHEKGIKNRETRKKKLDNEYLDYIVDLAKNQTTSSMGGRKIPALVNDKLKEENITYKTGKNKGKIMTIGKTMVTDYLKKQFLAPRKIKKVFFLSHQQKKDRLNFCKKILEKHIEGKNIFFTDETTIDLSPFTYDPIRISKEDQEKLKQGNPEIAELVNRPEKNLKKKL